MEEVLVRTGLGIVEGRDVLVVAVVVMMWWLEKARVEWVVKGEVEIRVVGDEWDGAEAGVKLQEWRGQGEGEEAAV